MKRRVFLALFLCPMVFVACNADKSNQSAEQELVKAAQGLAENKEKIDSSSKVRLKTTLGDILLQLDSEKAPITSANFLKYVGEKHYDGTVFHRVIDGFMIQGGGFALEKEAIVEKKTGEGIKNESQNGLKNEKGTIAMARTNDPNSATAQFFINVEDNQSLNYPNYGGYAVFGKVIEGMEVVDRIRTVKTTSKRLSMRHPSTAQVIESSANDVPEDAILILSASAE